MRLDARAGYMMLAGIVVVAVLIVLALGEGGGYGVEAIGFGQGPAWLGYRGNDLKGPLGRWAVLIDGIAPGSPLDLTGAKCGDWIVGVETRDGWFSPRVLKDHAAAGQWSRVLLARATEEGWLLWASWVRLASWPVREPQYRCP
ncbi:MAG: hypothetical protein PHZ19_06045 [Candidatus Thermoplasmatota archaeon]|nr:hypothetical protein [Candidatus Thermoplasmatota archaeon]